MGESDSEEHDREEERSSELSSTFEKSEDVTEKNPYKVAIETALRLLDKEDWPCSEETQRDF